MLTLSVKIKNYNEIREAIEEAPEEITKAASIAIQKSIFRVEREAKKQAPVNKQSGGGNLRQSISARMIGTLRGVVRVGAEYAEYVHEGTRPHVITAKTKKTLANRRTGQMFGCVVHHPGTKANPFLDRAVKASEEFIQSEFMKIPDNTLDDL